jgi:hypothetical protein
MRAAFLECRLTESHLAPDVQVSTVRISKRVAGKTCPFGVLDTEKIRFKIRTGFVGVQEC